MGIKLTDASGSAQKNSIEQYQMKNGDNAVRLFGDLLPRYIYWVKGENDKNIPVENLSFDRDTESWANKEKNWVAERYPDIKAGWAYSIQCIDMADNKAKVFNLKKKLLDQIIAASKDLGDPCDLDKGWVVHFTKKKTGPNIFNVEYTLNQIKSMKSAGPVTDEQRKVIEEAKPIDEILPRPTPDQQKEFLDRIAGVDKEDNVDEELDEHFDVA